MLSSKSKEAAPKMGRKSSKSVSPRLHFELISLTRVVQFSRIHRYSLRSTKRANLTFVCGREEGGEKIQRVMAKASNNKQKFIKHTHIGEERRRERERERERENGRVARGAHLHPLHFQSSSTSHPFCEHFVWTNFVASSIFCMPFDAKGGRRGQIVCRVMAKATNITLKRSIFRFFLVLDWKLECTHTPPTFIIQSNYVLTSKLTNQKSWVQSISSLSFTSFLNGVVEWKCLKAFKKILCIHPNHMKSKCFVNQLILTLGFHKIKGTKYVLSSLTLPKTMIMRSSIRFINSSRWWLMIWLNAHWTHNLEVF